jgi:hypothetical protein
MEKVSGERPEPPLVAVEPVMMAILMKRKG